MTLLDLRTTVLTRANESGAAGYTSDQADAVLNEGLRLFALMTLCVERTIVTRLQPDAVWRQLLTLLPDFLVPLRVRCHVLQSGAAVSEWDVPLWDQAEFDELSPAPQTVMTPVRPCRLTDLDALSLAWETDRNATVKRYGCLGVDLFWIHPAPSAAGTSLELVYAAMPTALANASDVPEIPASYHAGLVDYALSALPLKFGGAELGDSAALFARFLEGAKTCGEMVRTRARALQYDRTPFELRLRPRKEPAKGKKQ
jgi:hypothetical protein